MKLSLNDLSDTPAVKIDHVTKAFSDKLAVNDLSFTVNCGEIFGLIGPNGAGKTTTIRMMMDIIKPDSGNISILGQTLCEAVKTRLGYLPEERGLYKKLSVMDSILYLASLKGMDKRSVERKANSLLDATGMLSNKSKKIDELSKGMGQIIQFIITIIHNPDLVVLDEAFSGLDPVNTELLKGLVIDLKNQGKAVVMSTHQMNQVEELCDRILMVDRGQAVLYGDLREIKSRYRSNAVVVDFEGQLGEVIGATVAELKRGSAEMMLQGNTSPQQVLDQLVSRGVSISRFEVATPSLNEIFLKVAGNKDE